MLIRRWIKKTIKIKPSRKKIAYNKSKSKRGEIFLKKRGVSSILDYKHSNKIDHSNFSKDKNYNITCWLEDSSLSSKEKGDRFENLICFIFDLENYFVHHTGGSNDRGIDILLYKDSKWTVVQCKNTKNLIPAHQIRELNGVLHSKIPKIDEYPSNIWLVTNNTISENQKDIIKELNKDNNSSIRCYDNDWLNKKFDKHYYEIIKYIKKRYKLHTFDEDSVIL